MFNVGQKVICISDDWVWQSEPITLPKKGVIYTVRGIETPPLEFTKWLQEGEYIWVVEIINHVISGVSEGIFFSQEPSFWSGFFRPIVEQKTDISVFTEMLKFDKILEDA